MQIRGANGSGKTTLLRSLCGLTLAQSGRIEWMGENIAEDPQSIRANLAYVGHLDGIKLELSVSENIQFAQAMSARSSQPATAEVLQRLGLASFANVTARALSAGQRRKVALARVLVSDVTLWILDEPFTALDQESQSLVCELLELHASNGGIAIFTSHQDIALSKPAKTVTV